MMFKYKQHLLASPHNRGPMRLQEEFTALPPNSVGDRHKKVITPYSNFPNTDRQDFRFTWNLSPHDWR